MARLDDADAFAKSLADADRSAHSDSDGHTFANSDADSHVDADSNAGNTPHAHSRLDGGPNPRTDLCRRLRVGDAQRLGKGRNRWDRPAHHQVARRILRHGHVRE